MKDSQPVESVTPVGSSISRRIMKDSQPQLDQGTSSHKYIKANNERFSTTPLDDVRLW